MSYATLQDLIDRFGEDELIQLTDRADPPAGTIDETVAARALADADELIDGYVAGRYRVPLAPIPAMVTRLACDLARFFLHDDLPTDSVKEAHQAALKTLREISAGTVKLQAAGVEAASGSGGDVLVSGPGRVLTSDSLKGF
ncbi:MAG: DUF1320 domain-containing protein [Rhodospirillales bacterium]|jgi:phage gp36-like protein|nr:DUF1320 domain-containing protein [Rhodospirillales bacterium]